MKHSDAMALEETLLQVRMALEELPESAARGEALAHLSDALAMAGRHHARAIDAMVADAVALGIFG